jgi:hypothetical protein
MRKVTLKVAFSFPCGQIRDISPDMTINPFSVLSEFNRLEKVEIYRSKWSPNPNKPSPFLQLPATLKTLVLQWLWLATDRDNRTLFFMNINWNAQFPLLETLRIGSPRYGAQVERESDHNDRWLATLPRHLRNLSLVYCVYDPVEAYRWVTQPVTLGEIPQELRLSTESSLLTSSVVYRYPILERLELSSKAMVSFNGAPETLPPSIRGLKFTPVQFLTKYVALPPPHIDDDATLAASGLESLDLSFSYDAPSNHWWRLVEAQKGLRHLRLTSSEPCPPETFSTHLLCLSILDIDFTLTSEHFQALTPHLEVFKLRSESALHSALQTWLRRTTRLHTFYCSEKFHTNEFLATLPYTLTELKVGIAKHIVPDFPPSLRTLILTSSIDPQNLRTLPRSITHLEMILPSLPFLERDQEPVPMPAVPFGDLPPNLLFLSIPYGHVTIESIRDLPQTLVFIQLGERLELPPTPPQDRGFMKALSNMLFSRSNGTEELIQSTMALFPPNALVDARFSRDLCTIARYLPLKFTRYAFHSTWYRLLHD